MTAATAAAIALLPGPLDGPLCTALDLATASLAAALAWTAMATVREEERLNARGETLVPRRWRYDRRAILLGTAGALAEAVEGLGLLRGAVAGIEAAGGSGRQWRAPAYPRSQWV